MRRSVDRAADILVSGGFERVSSVFAIPTGPSAGDLRYAVSADLSDEGGQLWLRSFGSDFNIVPRRWLRFGLRSVFSVGPGLVHDKQADVLLLQAFRPEPRIREVVMRALSCCAMSEVADGEVYGVSCLRGAAAASD